MITVGIDIGTSSVKLAEIQASSKSFSLTRFQEFPLSNDPNKDKKIEILDILRQIARAFDLDATRFVMAVPEQHAVLRYKQFPFKERFKILRSIAFELEDDIPFSQDDAVFDAKITRYVGNSAADVIACAVPTEYIKEVVQMARDAGMDLALISVDGLALANSLENWQSSPPIMPPLGATPEANPAEIILDIGHNRSLVVLHSGGSLLHARNLDWGGRNIADAIAAKYGIHYLEALKELQKKAFVLLSNEGASKDQMVFSDVIKQALEPLIQSIQFTLLEFSNSRNVRFNQIHITGGVSQIKNLAPYLTQMWEVAVNRFRHLDSIPQIGIEKSSHAEAVSAVAVGLALEGLRRPRNPAVNLLKGEFAGSADNFKVFWTKWGHATQLVLATFFCLLIYGFLRSNFAADMADAALTTLKDQAAAVADLKGRMATPTAIRRFVKQKKEELSARKLAIGVKQINSALDVIAAIHKVAPSSKQMLVEIRKLSVANEFVELHGEVADAGAMGQLRQALLTMASDGRVEPIAPASNPTPGKTAFGFRFKVDRRKGA
jgi:general secretion pathway protein L